MVAEFYAFLSRPGVRTPRVRGWPARPLSGLQTAAGAWDAVQSSAAGRAAVKAAGAILAGPFPTWAAARQALWEEWASEFAVLEACKADAGR